MRKPGHSTLSGWVRHWLGCPDSNHQSGWRPSSAGAVSWSGCDQRLGSSRKRDSVKRSLTTEQQKSQDLPSGRLSNSHSLDGTEKSHLWSVTAGATGAPESKLPSSREIRCTDSV